MNPLPSKKFEENIVDLKSSIESKGFLGKVDISFSGRALLDPKKKIVTYWDMIKKSSAGFGAENMGFSSEAYTVQGVERSGSGGGNVLGGVKYNYDYGKVRELVRSLALRNGWQFKVTLIKPKWWKGFFE